MESLILENFRCFAGRHEVPLRPLTLLVGENSTGKTSFLAAARLVEALQASPVESPDFNVGPFNLGAFEEIATHRTVKGGRANAFKLGGTFAGSSNTSEPAVLDFQFTVAFNNVAGLPAISRLLFRHQQYEIKVDAPVTTRSISVKTPEKPGWLVIEPKLFEDAPAKLDAVQPQISIFYFFSFFQHGEPAELTKNEWNTLRRLRNAWFHRTTSLPIALAPIRAQPQRTYEVLNDDPQPQGDHVPVLLARIYGKDEWERLRQPLEKFAKTSGLFEEIIVKRLGKSESSPFQIHVKLGGPARNIIDVGYGVNQVLPLVVDLLRDQRPRMYLVQQPEVHLHPRAQAALGSLFAAIAKGHKKQLLVETHSDYIVDRVRMDVRDKLIEPADVVILFFERKRGEVTISPIHLDEEGNLIDVPPSYRSFFLQEEEKFLGFSNVPHS